MQRRNRDPIQEFSRAMDEREYPLLGIYDEDMPRKLQGLARVGEYTDRLERDRGLGRHLLSPDRFWQHGPMEAATLPSDKHPERNEDHYYAFSRNGTLVGGVFDGLGGHANGERASKVAAAASHNFVQRHVTEYMRPEDSVLLLSESLQFANAAIALENRKLGTHSDAATTAAVAALHAHPDMSGRRYAAMAWVGDSRIYLIRGQEVLYSSLDDPGFIYRGEDYTKRQLQTFLEATGDSAEDRAMRQGDRQLSQAFLYRNIVGACLDGGYDNYINVDTRDVEPGDIILATTDGIHDNLTRREIAELTNVKDLLVAALARSRDPEHPRAKPDDMTAVMLHVQ